MQPPSAPMTRADLSHVCLAVPDPEATADFYAANLGMCREPGEDGSLRLGWGTGFHALELRQGDGLDHFGFSLPSAAALAELEARISSHGVAVEQRPAAGGSHPEALVVRDPDGNEIELHGPVDRSGEHAADPGRRPVRIHHVTLGSPAVVQQAAFYRDVLGFRVSDQMEEVFFWLRCNHEHHTLAVVDAERPGLDHYCYEVDSWGSFKVWCDELATREVPITWGPGRHGPGNNLFLFLDDPAGNRIELSAEMERFWDDAVEYRGRTWSVTDRTLNLWGPMPSWRDRVS